MKANLTAFLAGLIFAGGLVAGGMTQPQKVVDFLDFAGAWDPSLAFVMLGAILVNVLAYRFVVPRRQTPVLTDLFAIPKRTDLTLPLIGGSVLFGVGWGLGGYCPGPGIVALGSFGPEALVFVTSMGLGMLLHHLITRTPAERSTQPSEQPLEPTDAAAADA